MIKKILSLILCIAFSLTLLVGCAEDVIASDEEIQELYDKYIKGEKVYKTTLNMYVITDDTTTENAKATVKQLISSHTSDNYNSPLNIFYCTEAEYETTVKEAIKAGGANAPHIILINSEKLYNDLVNAEGGNKLLDIASYLRTKTYGKLNTQICESLLSAARVNGKLYVLPNNHVVGGNSGYEYFVINKQVAHHECLEELSVLESYKNTTDASELIARITAKGYDASKLVYSVTGPYELKAQLEQQGFICNVVKYPTATPAEVFSGAFAIVKNSDSLYNDRAMQILNAINNDTELRNLLQYGVQGTNYLLDTKGNVTRVNDGNNVYHMNLLYTGDIFKAMYCEELGWTKDIHSNGLVQNDESVAQ